jgi:hypothetical protein
VSVADGGGLKKLVSTEFAEVKAEPCSAPSIIGLFIPPLVASLGFVDVVVMVNLPGLPEQLVNTDVVVVVAPVVISMQFY